MGNNMPNEGQNKQPQRPGLLDGFVSKPQMDAQQQAQDRARAVTRKVDGLRRDVEQSKDGRLRLPGEKTLDAAGLAVVKKIEEMANALKGVVTSPEFHNGARDTLASALALLRSQPSLTLAPTKELVDSLITVGKANKGNTDPFVQEDVQELRALVIQMQAELAKQPQVVGAMPNIVINNNLGPQAAPQAAAPAAPEKKEEQLGWREEGRQLMYQYVSRVSQIKQLQDYRQQRIDGGSWTPDDQKQFTRDAEALSAQRRQILRTVNALVEDARKPSGDRNLIAATREETDLQMNRWLNEYAIRGIMVKNGAFTGA